MDFDSASTPFLSSSRAQTICGRQLDRIASEIERLAAAMATELGASAEVSRSPGRCIVQMGDVALTTSWMRAPGNAVADGRLLIVAWRGTVAPKNSVAPERTTRNQPTRQATPLREIVLMPVATCEADWGWQRESQPGISLQAADIAARSVDSLGEDFRST